MLLPVYITESWISACLIKEGEFTIKDGAFVKISYTPSYLDSALTNAKLEVLLKNTFKKFNPSEASIITVADKAVVNNIKVNYILDDVAKSIPFPLIPVNTYDVGEFKELNGFSMNDYMNLVKYRQDIPIDVRKELEHRQLFKILEARVGDFMDVNRIAVLTVPVSVKSKEQYMAGIIHDFAQLIKITGVWKFHLDDTYSIIPVTAALMHLKKDASEYFKTNPLHSHGKLIIAPGVDVIEVLSEDGKEVVDTKALEIGTMNSIPLTPDESMHVRWKTKKSKFEGKLYGSDLGLLVKT